MLVILFEETRADIEIHISASISSKGDLKIEGYDSGKLVQELRGEWEYEYYLTVKKGNKERLIETLRNRKTEISNDKALLDWVKDNFSGNTAISSFQKYLTDEHIDFEVFYWK